MRVRFEPDTYNKLIVYAYCKNEGLKFASIIPCPRGLAVRIYCIPAGTRDATMIASSIDEAKAIVEQWVSGLEIMPWE